MTRTPRRMLAPVLMAATILGLGILAAGIFAAMGVTGLRALLDGLLLAVVASMAVFILWTVLAPASFLRWRYKAFGINASDRREPWRDAQSIRAMRLVGVVTIFAAAPISLMLFLELRRAFG